MVINSTNYKADERKFITTEGNYLLKLVKWETDGYTQNGDLKFKIACEAGKITESGKIEGSYSFNYQMLDGEKTGFTIARLRDAIKSPAVFNLDDWIGRYVYASIFMEMGSDGKMYPKVSSFEYSKFNDKKNPIQEAVEGNDKPSGSNVEEASAPNPSVDINPEEIPF